MANRKDRDTKKFRESIENAKPKIMDLLDQKRYLLRRSIQVILEEEFSIWQTVTWNAIEELKKENKLRTSKYPFKGDYPVWVYKEDLRIDDIRNEIMKESLPLWKKFLSKSTDMGSYAEDIIEQALTKAGFCIVSKKDKTRYFYGREYPKSSNVEFIAYNNGVFYGIEVKQKLSYPDFNEIIDNKKSLADFHGIQFLLISRRLGPYSYQLFRERGLYLEFGKVYWRSKYSPIAEECREILGFPIECVDEPPDNLINKLKEIPKLHDKYFNETGRID